SSPSDSSPKKCHCNACQALAYCSVAFLMQFSCLHVESTSYEKQRGYSVANSDSICQVFNSTPSDRRFRHETATRQGPNGGAGDERPLWEISAARRRTDSPQPPIRSER